MRSERPASDRRPRRSRRSRIFGGGSAAHSAVAKAERASRSRVELSRMPGTKATAITTKSKMFQPERKKSCEAPPVGTDAENQLDDEDGQEEVVEEVQQLAARSSISGYVWRPRTTALAMMTTRMKPVRTATRRVAGADVGAPELARRAFSVRVGCYQRRRMRRAYGSARFSPMARCLRSGLVERRDELLEVLDLQQSALVLVVGPPRVGSPSLGRLAVTQVQDVLFRGGTMSSQSKHDDPPRSAA